MTITEECGCGASLTITTEYGLSHTMGYFQQWREEHLHVVAPMMPDIPDITELEQRLT